MQEIKFGKIYIFILLLISIDFCEYNKTIYKLNLLYDNNNSACNICLFYGLSMSPHSEYEYYKCVFANEAKDKALILIVK